MCNTPFCNCNCCIASCKKSRMTLYFSKRCQTSCLRVTSPLQLERFLFVVALQVARKIASCNMAFNVGCNHDLLLIITNGQSQYCSMRHSIIAIIAALHKVIEQNDCKVWQYFLYLQCFSQLGIPYPSLTPLVVPYEKHS